MPEFKCLLMNRGELKFTNPSYYFRLGLKWLHVHHLYSVQIRSCQPLLYKSTAYLPFKID